MRRILLPALLIAAYSTQAQDLAYKIPKSATAVASVKGDKLLELFSIPEFNQSVVIKKFLEKRERDGNGSYRSIEDLGLQLSGTAYYFSQQTDSISYNCLWLPLSDVARFERLFSEEERKNIKTEGNTRTLFSGTTVWIWDQEKAFFSSGKLKDGYIEEDSIRSESYGIKKVNYSDYYYNTAPYPVEEAEADTTAAAYAVPAADYADSAVAVADDSEMLEEPALVEVPPTPPPPAFPSENYADSAVSEAAQVVEQYEYTPSAYNEAYEANLKAKKKLTIGWLTHFAFSGFHKAAGSGSILDNASYLRSQDKNAAATFYLADVPSLYQGFIPYYSYRYLGLANAMQGYGSINAKLYLHKEDARITTEMELDDKKIAAYKKMYAHKPNKKFAKYINSDKMIGFMSYSFDTEAYLKELPELMDQSMAHYFGLYADEIGIGAELFSLLLDEKAVAKVIKGDAVLLISDVGPKEYTYTTYEYDDNYERTEVKKTKTETLPEFLFMLSSDDTHLLERLLQYGIRKEKVTLKNGIYTLDRKAVRSSPFTLHLLIKDGIVFCGTSLRGLQQIGADSYSGNMTKEQKNLLLKSNVSLFFNPKNLVGKISEKEFGNSHKLHEFNTLLGNTGAIYARSTGIKDNRISGELVATVPQDKGNALKYFFAWVEYAAKLD